MRRGVRLARPSKALHHRALAHHDSLPDVVRDSARGYLAVTGCAAARRRSRCRRHGDLGAGGARERGYAQQGDEAANVACCELAAERVAPSALLGGQSAGSGALDV